MRLVNHGDRSERKIALTFDDGPNPWFTLRCLDLLDAYGAKASFFLIGRWVDEWPGLAREIVARGHVVGGHTYTHGGDDDKGPYGDFRRGNEAIERATGQTVKYIRFPGFDLSRVVDFVPVVWELDNEPSLKDVTVVGHDDSFGADYACDGVTLLAEVIGRARNGFIQDLHGSSQRERELKPRAEGLLRVLPAILAGLRDYELVTLDNMKLVYEIR